MRIDQFRANVVEALTDALPEGMPVFGWEDAKFVTPAAYVMPAEPFIDRSGQVSQATPYATHWLVQLIAGRGSGDWVRRHLEEMIAATLLALDGVDDSDARLSVDEVEYPKFGSHGGKTFTGADITITASISLKES